MAGMKTIMAGFSSLGDFVDYIVKTYNVEFLVLETAQLFRDGGNDKHVDILGEKTSPPGIPIRPLRRHRKITLPTSPWKYSTTEDQGVITWGNEWVGCDCYIYADQWGKGSSWENKAYWDFDI